MGLNNESKIIEVSRTCVRQLYPKSRAEIKLPIRGTPSHNREVAKHISGADVVVLRMLGEKTTAYAVIRSEGLLQNLYRRVLPEKMDGVNHLRWAEEIEEVALRPVIIAL